MNPTSRHDKIVTKQYKNYVNYRNALRSSHLCCLLVKVSAMLLLLQMTWHLLAEDSVVSRVREPRGEFPKQKLTVCFDDGGGKRFLLN